MANRRQSGSHLRKQIDFVVGGGGVEYVKTAHSHTRRYPIWCDFSTRKASTFLHSRINDWLQDFIGATHFSIANILYIRKKKLLYICFEVLLFYFIFFLF